MKTLTADTQNLEALFGIEIEADGADQTAVVSAWGKIQCRKCKGSGNFIGYSGRIVGKCFICKGAGVVMTEASTAAAIDVSKITVAFAAVR